MQSDLELSVPTSDHKSHQQELNANVSNEAEVTEDTREADLRGNTNTTTTKNSTTQRTSSRISKPPIWMKDYVTGVTKSVHPHSLANYVSYSQLSSKYQAYLSKISLDIEPKNYEEAVKDPRWVEIIKQEIDALEANGIWNIVQLLPNKRVIGCIWVYKIKYKANGEVKKFKARLVFEGYSQTEGIDYQETFSPVVKMVTIRYIIAIATTKNWVIYQMEIFNAFLQGGLFEKCRWNCLRGLPVKGRIRYVGLLSHFMNLHKHIDNGMSS